MECGLQKKTFTILLDTRTPSYYHLDFSHHDSLFIPTKTVTMSTNKGTAPDRLLAFYLPHCLPLHTSAPKNPGSNYFIAWDISSLLPEKCKALIYLFTFQKCNFFILELIPLVTLVIHTMSQEFEIKFSVVGCYSNLTTTKALNKPKRLTSRDKIEPLHGSRRPWRSSCCSQYPRRRCSQCLWRTSFCTQCPWRTYHSSRYPWWPPGRILTSPKKSCSLDSLFFENLGFFLW